MPATMSVAIIVLLIMLISAQTPSAQLNINVQTLPDTGGSPNTFVTLSDSIASSLLSSGTPVLLWVVMTSNYVTAACQQIVGTGSLNFDVTATDPNNGHVQTFTVQVTATGGCEAAADESGTEIVWVDNFGRSAAVVCPQNASSLGCGVYMTGDNVTAFYHQNVQEAEEGSRRRILSTGIERRMLGPGTCTWGEYIFGWGLTVVVIQPTAFALCGLLPFPANFICYLPSAAIGPFIASYLVWCGGAQTVASCFPGDATLQLPGGISKSMAELDLGDKVAVWKPDGTLGYEDIYCFGHRDDITTSRFYKISLNSSEGLETSLELSGRHFAPVLSRPGIHSQKMVYLRAQEIRIGDMMWGLHDYDTIKVYTVTGVTIRVKRGLYNPFTMTGTIVVNGVVASAHSDWFLDEVFDKLGVTHLLPVTYQVALAPPRMLYRVMGKKFYTRVYDWLNEHLNLVQHISDYSGIGASMTLVGAALGAPAWYFFKKSKR